ncbi:MAG: L-lactate dehydrogenase [Planctomycetota bacterium]
MNHEKRKVVIIGAGSVGATYAYALMHTGLADLIVLVDLDKKHAEGEVMDISHGLAFVPPVEIRAGDYADCADANLIVVTAGAKQKPDQTRLQLIQANVKIIDIIADQIKQHDSSAIVVMVTNPVDILTYTAIQRLGWPGGRVIGSGTVLDSARFRYMLSEHCGIDTRSVHAYILGEHGDSEVAAWSLAHIGGVAMNDYCRMCQKCDAAKKHIEIAKNVRDSAYHIIDYKGSTYYAIGLSLVRISTAILRNEHSVLTVSSLLQGEYGLSDVCLSVPCVVGEAGVERIITADLLPQEQSALHKSAQTLKEVLGSITP